MIHKKTPQELSLMKAGGKILGGILRDLLTMATPGVNVLSIEAAAQEKIKRAGCVPSFTTVGDYRWATCLCLNDEVVHGVPRDRKLRAGDLLTIDVGLIYKGFHVDTGWTKIITNPSYSPDKKIVEFLNTGVSALQAGIAQARPGNYVGDISAAIESIIKPAGYSIIKTLVGHGVGKELHEPPQIPGFLKGRREDTPKLLAGVTIAIEVIYAAGRGSIVYTNDDGWTLATRDRSLSAVFEHSVAITPEGPLILTHRQK